MSNESQSISIDELLSIEASSITTLIDSDVKIEGKIFVNNGRSVLISGVVEGSIESNGAVIINSGGRVIGSIKSKSLQVAGSIDQLKDEDLIEVFGPIILAETAVVNCNVVSDGIKTVYGAVMSGSFRPRSKQVTPLQNQKNSSELVEV